MPRPRRLQRQDRAIAIGEFTQHGIRLRAIGPDARAPLPPAPQRIGIRDLTTVEGDVNGDGVAVLAIVTSGDQTGYDNFVL